MQFIQTELAGAIGDSFLHSLGGYMSMDMLIKGVCISDYTSDLYILEIGMVDWLSKMWTSAERIGTQ